MTWIVGTLAIIPWFQSPVVIDQIAIVVGKHAVKTSDLLRDLRVTEFLNNEPPDMGLAARRASAQRLIDQELIRVDFAAAGNTGHMETEAWALFDQLMRDRFKGSEAQLLAELQRRSLTKEQLLAQLQWQLVVLRFIDERFRPGVLITDDDVRAYYEQHAADLKRQDSTLTSLDAATPKIKELLEGEQINRDFEKWLDDARKAAPIDYKLGELK